MLYALTFAGPDADAVEGVAHRARALAGEAGEVKTVSTLGPGGHDLLVEAEDRAALAQAAEAASRGMPVDHCLQPDEGRRKRLLLADMDSTIIGCECLDELADYAGGEGGSGGGYRARHARRDRLRGRPARAGG